MRKREVWGMGQDMVLNLVCEYSESGTWFVSFFVQHDVATQTSLAAWPSLTVQTEYIVFPCFPDALDDFSSDKSEKFLCFFVLPFATGGFIVWGWGGIGLPLFERPLCKPKWSAICIHLHPFAIYCLLPLPFCSKSFPDRMLKKLHLRNSRSAKCRVVQWATQDSRQWDITQWGREWLKI